jgi:hypothetical protein
MDLKIDDRSISVKVGVDVESIAYLSGGIFLAILLGVFLAHAIVRKI